MKEIVLLVMDVDGTLTDGKIYMGNCGEMIKAFNIKDGYAINEILPHYGIEPIVITGRESLIVEKRCEELGIKKLYQKCSNKKEKLLEIAIKKGLSIKDGKIQGVAYIGDDLQDISSMEISEWVGCPSDAVDEIKKISNYVCKNKGGEGAVREYIEWLIYQRTK